MASKRLSELHQLQALPLIIKIEKSKERIREWVGKYGIDGVYVSFSGGKDSTVLLHLCRTLFPEMKALYVDTGLEFPELRQHVKKIDNVDWVKPKKPFRQIIDEYGYPFISKEVSAAVYGAKIHLRDLANNTDTLSGGRNTSSKVRYKYFYEKVTGTGAYSKHSDRGGTVDDSSELSEASNLEEIAWTQDGFDNVRVQRTLGVLPTKGKAKLDEVNKEQKVIDRSQFSCEKYKFFLNSEVDISNRCCNINKKSPAHTYTRKTNRKPITGQMASESRLRTQQWVKNGCNGFDMKSPVSNPLSFWTEQDILLYIQSMREEYKMNVLIANKRLKCITRKQIKEARKWLIRMRELGELRFLELAKPYGEIVTEDGSEVESWRELMEYGIFDNERPLLKTTGCSRTGCMWCGFGSHIKGDDRFIYLKEHYPKVYEYIMRKPMIVLNKGADEEYQKYVDFLNQKAGKFVKKSELQDLIDSVDELKECCHIVDGLNYKNVIDFINEAGNLNIRY